MTTKLRLYVVPNGRGDSAISCPECRACPVPESDYVLRCDVGLFHVYICEGVSQDWLMGRKACDPARVGLVTRMRWLRPVLDEQGCHILDSFVSLVAMARG